AGKADKESGRELGGAGSRYQTHVRRAARFSLESLVRPGRSQELVGAKRIHTSLCCDGSATRRQVAGAHGVARWKGLLAARSLSRDRSPREDRVYLYLGLRATTR